MKRNILWNLAVVFAAAVALGASLMLLPHQSHAQGGGVSSQAAVGTAFTYQGQLRGFWAK